MKIMIFTEGTILMHKSAYRHSRDEIIQQVIHHVPLVKEYATYIPIAHPVDTIQNWVNQGAEIIYITSRKKENEIVDIQTVLTKNNFPKGALEHRRENETYEDVAERIIPDVLIEDDCESIGGEKEMTYPHITPKNKEKIKSIIVKEFGGIDHLPNKIEFL